MATLVRFDPFRELAGFQSEMSRLMNGLLEGNGRDDAGLGARARRLGDRGRDRLRVRPSRASRRTRSPSSSRTTCSP